MDPLTQGSERSLGPWQIYKVVFAASIKMQLCMDVMHGRQREAGLLLSTLYSGHTGLPCRKAVAISSPESHDAVLTPMGYNPPGFSVRGDSPGKDTGVGCHALLQGIFPTQGLNPGLPQCRQILYHLSHQGSHPSLW